MAGALEVLAKDQVLTSPTSVTWNVLSSIGAIDVVRPFKNLIDTFETLSEMTINAKAGSNDATTFGMTINTFILNTKKFQERFVSTSTFELCDCYCLMFQRNILYNIYILLYIIYIYIILYIYYIYNIKVIIISYMYFREAGNDVVHCVALCWVSLEWCYRNLQGVDQFVEWCQEQDHYMQGRCVWREACFIGDCLREGWQTFSRWFLQTCRRSDTTCCSIARWSSRSPEVAWHWPIQ